MIKCYIFFCLVFFFSVCLFSSCIGFVHSVSSQVPCTQIPDDLWLYIARGCDGPEINTMASLCHHFRQLFRCSRQFVMVATHRIGQTATNSLRDWLMCPILAAPARIQSGMLHWLEQCISDSVGGPPMGALTIVLPDMPVDHQGHHESRCLTRQTEFLRAVRVAAAAIPIVKLIIGLCVPLSLSLLADALQSLACGGHLVLDLSDRVVYQNQQHLITLHTARPLWATLVQLTVLRLDLDGLSVKNNVVLGMVCAIEASLTRIGPFPVPCLQEMCPILSWTTNQPVAWRDVKLGLSRNSITDEGLTRMIQSLGRCPQLVQLTLDLTFNQHIRHPEKLDRLLCALGHIPSLHIRLDTIFCYMPLRRTSD